MILASLIWQYGQIYLLKKSPLIRKNLNKKHIKKEQPTSTSSLTIKASTLVSLPQTKIM
jgi:hypothetical protein